MAVGAREARRALALDVRSVIWQEKRFDAARFVHTGHLVDWGNYGVPDTPAMREAQAEIEREREMHLKAGRG